MNDMSVIVGQQRMMQREYNDRTGILNCKDSFIKMSPMTLADAKQQIADLFSIRDGSLMIHTEPTLAMTVAAEIELKVLLHRKYETAQAIDITAIATWSSTTPANATVAAGVITGVAAGTTEIYATYNEMESNHITVTVS